MASTSPSATGLPPATLATLKAQKALLERMAADAFNDLGTAEARQQRFDVALVAFQKAEGFGQPTPTLLRNLGTAAFRVQDNAEAARALQLYFAADPARAKNDARAHLMLGFAEFNAGHFRQATDAFSASPQAAESDPRAMYSWAYALAHTAHNQEANAMAKKLVAQSLPTDLLGLVCHVFIDAEDYEDGLACYRKEYAQDPLAHLAHYEAGEALVNMDRAADALPEFEAERTMTPGNPNVDYAYAYALLQVSRKAEAQKILEQVTTDHPEQAQAQYELGKLLLEQGNTPAAIEHLEASEKDDASSDYTHYQLGTAYRKAGRTADAEREFKTYREIKDRKREASTVPMGH